MGLVCIALVSFVKVGTLWLKKTFLRNLPPNVNVTADVMNYKRLRSQKHTKQKAITKSWSSFVWRRKSVGLVRAGDTCPAKQEKRTVHSQLSAKNQ